MKNYITEDEEIRLKIKTIELKVKSLPDSEKEKVSNALSFALYQIETFETDSILSAEVIG